MLKRLFISLIILSTLTSEGIMYLPGNVNSLCFFSAKSINGYQGESKTAEGNINDNESTGAIFGSASFRNAFIVAYSGAQKLKRLSSKAGSIFSDSLLSNNDGYYRLYSKSLYANIHLNKKNIIIKRSDSSPPTIV